LVTIALSVHESINELSNAQQNEKRTENFYEQLPVVPDKTSAIVGVKKPIQETVWPKNHPRSKRDREHCEHRRS